MLNIHVFTLYQGKRRSSVGFDLSLNLWSLMKFCISLVLLALYYLVDFRFSWSASW